MAARGCNRPPASDSRRRPRGRTRPFERPETVPASLRHYRAVAVALAVWAACARPAAPAPGLHWLGTWAASPQLTEQRNLPPPPGLAGSTLRQVVHISVGGRTLRVRFANTFGGSPLAVTSAHIARSRGGDVIDVASDRGLTFAGAGSVRIPPGAMATSDPLDYDAPTLGDLAITIHIGAAPAEVTGHPGSRTTSYLQAGQWVFSAELPDAVPIDHWYVIAGLAGPRCRGGNPAGRLPGDHRPRARPGPSHLRRHDPAVRRIPVRRRRSGGGAADRQPLDPQQQAVRCGHRLRRRATRSRRAFAPAAIGRHRGPPAPPRGRGPLDGPRDRPGAVHPLRRDEEMTAPFTLAGRVAVVTGGYGVLGGAIAAGLARAGAAGAVFGPRPGGAAAEAAPRPPEDGGGVTL